MTEKVPNRTWSCWRASPLLLATVVMTPKTTVNAHPSGDIGPSPHPTRRGPNQGFSPMIGVVRTHGSSRVQAATSTADRDRVRSAARE